MKKGKDDRLAPTAAQQARWLSRIRREAIGFLIEISETDPVALVSPNRPPGDVLNFASKLREFGLEPRGAMHLKDLVATLVAPPERETTTEAEEVEQLMEGARSFDEQIAARKLAQAQAIADQIKARPIRTLGPLVTNIKRLLAAMAGGGDVDLPLPAGCALRFDASYQKLIEGTRVWSHVSPSSAHRMQPPFLMVSLKVPGGASLSTRLAVFVFHAMQALDSEEGAMVRRCRREACRRIFLAARPTKTFCGRQCANAVSFERHAKKPAKL